MDDRSPPHSDPLGDAAYPEEEPLVAPADPGILGNVGSAARSAIGRAEDFLDRHDGVAGTLKRNPLAAVGIAFASGFLVAVTTGGKRRIRFIEQRRRQARALLLGGLTAAALQEVRSVIREEEVADMLRGWRDAGRKKLEDRDLL